MTNAQRLAFATCLATLFLIGVGVYVRATGSGLGCPDWPLCHGRVVPPTDSHHTIIEFSHRLVASIVGFMVIATAVMAWKFYRHVPFVVFFALVTVPLVGIQGLLGALTVVRELPPEIVATHLVTAMVVLGTELCVAVGMYLEDPARRERLRQLARPDTSSLRTALVVTLAWLAALMWIGGYMAESGASTACEGWPLCNGSVLPANDSQEITHMVHRYLAAGLSLLLVWVGVALWRLRGGLPYASVTAAVLAVLYLVQVMVGALNVWYTFPTSLAVSHTVIASLVWFVLAGTIVVAYYAPVAERRMATLSPAEVTA